MEWLDSSPKTEGLWLRVRMLGSSWVLHLFLSMVIILIVFLYPPSIFSGDTDTARNYLNTIVSSLSTILALCISIILVAIQLTASNYTHRVLDFFVRLPYNASLFTFYLVTIMHSFFLMAKIHDPVRDPLPVSLRPEMSADLVLVVICFVSLLMYMYAVVQLLKPDRIIDLILRDYHRAYTRGRWEAALANVEQICDMAKRAASVSDSATGTRCIDAMLHIGSGLPLPRNRQDARLKIHQSLVDQWVEIVGVAVKEKETGLLYQALSALHDQGALYVDGQAWAAAEIVVKAYRHLVFSHLLSEGQLFYVETVVDCLYNLGTCAVQKSARGEEFCLRTWQIIRAIGENVFAVQPSAVSTLMESFLMTKDVESTFQLLEQEVKQTRGVVIYFELWKACMAQATMRDAARWAEWWQARLDAHYAFTNGQSLAVLIGLHMHRQDIVETLCHLWGMAEQEVRQRGLSLEFTNYRIELFDGWPWKTSPSSASQPHASAP